MKKFLLTLILIIVLIAGIAVGYKLASDKNDSDLTHEAQNNSLETELFKDNKTGLEFSLPVGYKTVEIGENKSTTNPNSSVVMQLERTDPQSFVIVQHDKGIGTAASLAKQSPLEYLETTVRQFYPLRYGSSYKSESLERTKVGDKDAIEHIYSYIDKDGNPNKVRLLAIIWSSDETYNIILQSHASNFETVKDDMNTIKDSFKVQG